MRNTVQQHILRLESEQAAAINRRDLRGSLAMFDGNFVGFSSTKHERIRGLTALGKTFQHYWQRSPKMTYRVEDLRVLVSGRAAVATFYWSVGLGARRTIHGRGTHVFTRKGNSWRVVHEHFSRAH
ncbi:MAG TPA: nuclear transport factor 2 family protein [Candidatus Acidoferrales bacterium]|jgi:ketosteroid isomerase-like protein|nr:nuclear transport factor 2 family protein [Candidatus Acidoferrales bacterium]